MQEVFKRKNLNILQLPIDVENTGHITNCYIVWDTNNNAVVIDPAFDANKIIQVIKENNLEVKGMFLTHCHADHIAALKDLLDVYDIDVYIHKSDLENINNAEINCKDIVKVKLDNIDTTLFKSVNGEENIIISNMQFHIINTPGHTKGSIVLYEKSANILFTGDTIFDNSYGRTDLKTGSHNDMKNTLNHLFNKFENVECFAGHGNKFYIDDVKRKIRLLFSFWSDNR